MKRIALLCLLAGLSACETSPVSTQQTDNKEVTVDLLFTHDGCKVYRFLDDGFHYYAVCTQGAAATSSEIRVGKKHRPEEIATVSHP